LAGGFSITRPAMEDGEVVWDAKRKSFLSAKMALTQSQRINYLSPPMPIQPSEPNNFSKPVTRTGKSF
jgi:hypothetical protein